MKRSHLRKLLQMQLGFLVIALAQPAFTGAQEVSRQAIATSLNQPDANRNEPLLFASAQPVPVPVVPADGSSPGNFHAPSVASVAAIAVTMPRAKIVAHPFWDRQNRILFAANAAMASADFAVTRQNLGSHGKELNPITNMFGRSTPGLAANFALETGGVISVSYMLHKTGHHKLERITSYANLGGSTFAVAYGLSHR